MWHEKRPKVMVGNRLKVGGEQEGLSLKGERVSGTPESEN